MQFFHELNILEQTGVPDMVSVIDGLRVFNKIISKKHSLDMDSLPIEFGKGRSKPAVNIKLKTIRTALFSTQLPIDHIALMFTHCEKVYLSRD